MGKLSGKGREFGEVSTDWVTLDNLLEFRGSGWEAVTDWFFGRSEVDYDWSSTTDADRFFKWTYTADGTQASTLTVDPTTHQARIEATAGSQVALSNLREVLVIPETGNWGIAHAQTLIGPTFFDPDDSVNIRPQHGLALRAQEDTMRRTVIAWHDIAFGNPSVINLGVWVGSLDGSFFTNRQINISMNLGQTYTVSAASRTSNVTTATITGHNLRTGDRLNLDFGGGLIDPTHSQRASNVVTHTIGAHNFSTGGRVQVIFGGTFDGTFTITGITGTTISYSQTGSNETDADGAGLLLDKTDDRNSQAVTVVDANTISYADTGPNKTIGAGSAFRQFPYYMEARLIGTVAQVRCWDDRASSVPSWYSTTNALTVDLDKPDAVHVVGASSRIGGVVTLVTPTPHGAVRGSRVNVSVTDGTVSGNDFVVEEVTNNNVITYLQAGPDIPSSGNGTVTVRGAAASQADIDANPTPKGSGRIGFVASHLGTDDRSVCVYGPLYGDNDPFSQIVATTQPELAQATETGTAQPVRAVKTRTIGQVVEASTAQPVARRKVEATTQVTETSTAQALTETKRRTVTQAVETSQATGLVETTQGAVAFTPDAYLWRSTTAWNVYFSWCGWRRIDVDREDFTILAYLGNDTLSGGFQFTVDADRQLIVFDANDFSDLLAGTGPTLEVGDWWFLGVTTVAADEPDNVVIYYAKKGDSTLTQVTVSYSGPYEYVRHYVGARPGADGSDGAFRLHGSAGRDRSWRDTTLTPSEMAAEYLSDTAVKSGTWADWPMYNASTAVDDVSGNSRPLTSVPGSGTITTTSGPFDEIIEPVGQVTETSTAQTVTPRKTRTLGQVTETDTSGAVAERKVRAVQQTTETNVATAVARLKTELVAQAQETDTARPLTETKTDAISQATETDSAGVTAEAKSRAVQTATETDTSQPVGETKTKATGQAAEVDTAGLVTWAKSRTVGRAVETDAAQPVTAATGHVIGQAGETSTAQPVDTAKVHDLATAAEADAANALARLKTRALQQATETDSAQALTDSKIRILGRTDEADLARPLDRSKRLALQQALEVDVALPVSNLLVAPIGAALELDAATPVTHARTAHIGRAVELDEALAVVGVGGAVLDLEEIGDLAAAWSTGAGGESWAAARSAVSWSVGTLRRAP